MSGIWLDRYRNHLYSLLVQELHAGCETLISVAGQWHRLSKACSLEDHHFSSSSVPKMHNTNTIKSLSCWVFSQSKPSLYHIPFSIFLSSKTRKLKQQFTLWGLPPNLYLFLNLPHYFKVICRNLMYVMNFGLNCPMHLRDSLGAQNDFQKQDRSADICHCHSHDSCFSSQQRGLV